MPRQLKNWLTSWEQYLSNTEAPYNFRWWSGVSVLAATMKRNIIIQRGQYEIPPHIYMVLVGPPGVGKGEVITPAKKILTETGVVNIIKDATNIFETINELAIGWPTTVVTTPSVGATGGTVVTPAYDHTAILAVNEFSTFINAAPRTLDFMNALWDQSDFDYKTKKSGYALLRNFNLNLIGGCVPEFIHKINRDSATETVTGGFSSRCLFIYGQGKGAHHAWPLTPDTTLEKQLINDLLEIGLIKGKVKFSPEAMHWFDTYYHNFTNKLSEFDSLVVRNFRARYVAHAFKLALVLTIADVNWLQEQQKFIPQVGSGQIVIGRPRLQEALGKIEQIMKELDTVFASVGESRLAVGQDKVIRFLELRKSATFGQIFSALRRDIDKDDLDMILSSLLLTDPPVIIKSNMAGQGNREFYSPNKAIKLGQQQGKGVGHP